MRELKFRAWGKNIKEYLSQDGVEPYHYTLKDISEGCIYDLDLFVIEQYTGLKDKNGKEIYEGDIVKHDDVTFIVGWNDRHSRFGFAPVKNCDISMAFSMSKCEVIGNIHENGEQI